MFQSTFTLRWRLKNENSVRKHRTFPEESLKDKITTPQSQRVNNEVNITIQFKTFVVPYCDLQCLANHKFAFPSTVTRFCVLISSRRKPIYISFAVGYCMHIFRGQCFVYFAVEFRNSPRGQVWKETFLRHLRSLVTETCSLLQSSAEALSVRSLFDQEPYIINIPVPYLWRITCKYS